MPIYDLNATLELKRIADILEAIATKMGVNAGFQPAKDESDILYTDDEELERREMLRREYFDRTGIRVPDDELPPSPDHESWS